jgi:hypothetical protein
MFKTLNKATRLLLVAMILLLAVTSISFAQGQRYKSPDAWSFGVMGDTQWTIRSADDPNASANPNYFAKSIADQLQIQMAAKGVKFVFAMGDMSDRAKPGALTNRAQSATTTLYNANVGFFPMRGNHETYAWLYNYAPVESEIAELKAQFPQTQGTGNLFGTTNFSTPGVVSVISVENSPNADVTGLSYSFDFGAAGNNARFVVLDTQITGCTTSAQNGLTWWPTLCWGALAQDQQPWIDQRLDKNSRGTEHAFVLSHFPPMAEEHAGESLFSWFGGHSDANSSGQEDAFFASLQNNGVRYFLSGHDHLHQHSIIESRDGNSKLHEIIAAGNSTKFYHPSPIPYPAYDSNGNVTVEDQWYGQKVRETSLSQETQHVGFYIYTVDGPHVTIDYYSDDTGNLQDGNAWPYGSTEKSQRVTPTFTFSKRATWGYSTNGKEFVVANGEAYSVVADQFYGTSARILDGVNGSKEQDAGLPALVDENDRLLANAVNTGWAPQNSDKLKSDILTLWGMTDANSDQTDTFVLSMSFEWKRMVHLGNGGIGIASLNSQGQWVNAVDLNIGNSTKNFVVGPYQPGYTLGTYGVDPSSKTAWAVINYNADFAVANDIEPVPGHRK